MGICEDLVQLRTRFKVIILMCWIQNKTKKMEKRRRRSRNDVDFSLPPPPVPPSHCERSTLPIMSDPVADNYLKCVFANAQISDIKRDVIHVASLVK